MDEFFNKEIARELLLEVDPNIDNATVNKIWGMCNGNPWDAKPLFLILEAADKLHADGRKQVS